MSLKLINRYSTVAVNFRTMQLEALEVKVYRDTEWDEYVVRQYKNGIEQVPSNYHTDSRQDAFDTAIRMIN